MAHDQRTINTGFGDFSVSEGDVVTFPRGLPGFERCQRFVLLSHETIAPLRCLHALDGPDATFLAVDPRSIVADYVCGLEPEERDQIEATSETALLWLVLLTFTGDGLPTANLRAPIVINPDTMLATQFVIDDDRYAAQHELKAA